MSANASIVAGKHLAWRQCWVPAKPRLLVGSAWSHRQRNSRVAAYAAMPPQSQELIAELQSLDEEALHNWAVANRGALTLELLSHIAHVQSQADASAREKLWALGSKLMAVREGLVPVSSDVLQQELRSAAQHSPCATAALPDSMPTSISGRGDSGNGSRMNSSSGGSQDSTASVTAQVGNGSNVLPAAANGSSRMGHGELALADHAEPLRQHQPASSAFSFVVQRTAQLGLTPEGLSLLQQQAAGLEALVGAARARSLAEVIGRKQLSFEEQGGLPFEPDATTRILQLLLSIPDREERTALLPDAFTPAEPSLESTAGSSYDDIQSSPGASSDGEEELLSTTPLALLQAIDLQLSRLQRASSSPRGVTAFLAGGGGEFAEIPSDELLPRLQALREDVAAYWGDLGNMSGTEEF